jgi:hypothetical protein
VAALVVGAHHRPGAVPAVRLRDDRPLDPAEAEADEVEHERRVQEELAALQAGRG